jgi:putative ABC transport system permease protein
MQTILQDLRYSLRQLRQSPGFALFAVAVMALGIGANTAVFSVVNAVLLKPLAYRNADRIVKLASQWKNSPGYGQVSAPDFHDWHDQSTSFAALAYYESLETAVKPGSAAEYAFVAPVTPEFFGAFQLQPVAGRLFSADEQKPGGAGAVVISHAYGESHFGGSAKAVGQSLRLFGRTLDIVGVLPPGFHFPDQTDIWFPANTIVPETESRSGHNYLVVGRLKPDVTLEAAQAQMAAIGARLEQQYPASNKDKSVSVTRMRDAMVSDVRLTLYLLLAVVGVVLLIACANMANMLLARATARTREIAIRAAMGATRVRVARQLITESLVLALLAGVGGLLLALWGSRALVLLAPADVPRLAEAGVDGTVLAFTLGVSVIASLLFGLAPAFQVSRVDLIESLKQGATRSVVGGTAGRLRGAFVMAEIALSVVLLAGAGLLIKSFVALHNVALGFHPENVLVMDVSVPASDLDSSRRATQIYKNLLPRIAALPGVRSVGLTRGTPGHVASSGGYWIDHLPEELSVTSPQAVLSVVGPGAFATLGIPLDRGRDFSDGDTFDAPFSAIINEALARKSFPSQDPIGHVIYCGLDSLKPMTIIGIVGDIRQSGPARSPAPEIYMPYEQHPLPSTDLSVAVRTAGATGPLAESMRTKAQELSSEAPVKFTTLEASLSEDVAAPRFRTLLLGIFAALAVCLAMAGVYGVMAYVVGQRVHEIGLRMALGATPGNVLRMVLREGLLLAAGGIVLGLVAAAAASRLLTSMLFEVKPTDPLTYAAVVALLAFVALSASYVPARRATKVDPMVALRYE